MRNSYMWGVQFLDEDIVHQYATMEEAIECVKEYRKEGFEGYEAVQLDEDGGVQAIIVI